ncbi:hypothetical protein [Stenomitos frigidus]|uniref:hypothetical protein n=1 Tax=Stenomitos frigidus TaxID=1886765 RepID=UPI001C639EC1|nr:hypothetical protein [Stenomitos frigidus]
MHEKPESESIDRADGNASGPYVESLVIHAPDSLVSSTNQRVHIFNPALNDRTT